MRTTENQIPCETCREPATVSVVGLHFCKSCLDKIGAVYLAQEVVVHKQAQTATTFPDDTWDKRARKYGQPADEGTALRTQGVGSFITPSINQMIAEIRQKIVRGAASDELQKAARAVVDARYQSGDGWDRLKNAIGALEDLVGRT